jgi:hypothetical protein
MRRLVGWIKNNELKKYGSDCGLIEGRLLSRYFPKEPEENNVSPEYETGVLNTATKLVHFSRQQGSLQSWYERSAEEKPRPPWKLNAHHPSYRQCAAFYFRSSSSQSKISGLRVQRVSCPDGKAHSHVANGGSRQAVFQVVDANNSS